MDITRYLTPKGLVGLFVLAVLAMLFYRHPDVAVNFGFGFFHFASRVSELIFRHTQ
jgi:hypothetical protein